MGNAGAPCGRPSPRGRSRPREALEEQLADGLRVGRAAGLLHHLTEHGVQRAVLAPAELFDGPGALGDRLVNPGLERGGVPDLLQAAALDDRLDVIAGLERL